VFVRNLSILLPPEAAWTTACDGLREAQKPSRGTVNHQPSEGAQKARWALGEQTNDRPAQAIKEPSGARKDPDVSETVHMH